MASIMVNSGSFGSDRNDDTKVTCMQANSLHNSTSSPLTASSATQSNCKNDLTEAEDHGQLYKTHAVEPISSETKYLKSESYDDSLKSESPSGTNETKRSLFCRFPLEKVQTILSKYTKSDGSKMKGPRKVLCLYCDRTFVNINLLQKHVERCHSSKQLRRVSLRKHQNFLTSTPCFYCDKFTTTEHTLKELFKHLIENHANKYYGCLCCELRFLNSSHLADHNALCHNIITPQNSDSQNSVTQSQKQEPEAEPVKTVRKKQRRREAKLLELPGSIIEEPTKPGNIKNLRSKKLSVKSSRMIVKRSKRIQAKVTEPPKKRRTRDLNEKKKKQDRLDQNFSAKTTEKTTKAVSNFINPYPEFDHFFQVKKITDHSIDNLKISSLTFDDVFDKAFFNRIKCNIQENLLHHIDGKLFKNEESESRISNFEKISSTPPETQSLHSENYGCEISLNAIAPTTLLLSNQLGDDPESQIEYGSKPSKKKTQMKKDEVHYKYFTRRKYQASILEHKENRDLSKLDMWTQYVIKNRQQKIIDDKKSPKEILDYFAGDEYKSTMKREELNRILDRRGPFEDLREEVSKRAALDKLNRDSLNDDHSTEIGELLNDIINRVFELVKEPSIPANTTSQLNEEIPEIPSYLNLRSTKNIIPENEIDRSDKIALICSSQETENFELPSNTVRAKNEKVELTGEWARSRIYVCAACGLKLQNLKQFLEHKSAAHQYIWVQHYEFVGNQSELYRHLSIPVLGKVGVLENSNQCKVWKRSDARLCTKCGKQCNSLGELHRHILECGGDWTWMLARKKCKYRPFGAKSRRKRRGLVKRIYTQKTEPSEKKVYKKTYDKPSDAETIKRMLANLPPKRITRKIISLKDGFNTPRTRQVKTTKQPKFKCGKLIRGKTKEQATVVKSDYEKTSKGQNNNYRRSLRSLNQVLTSRILDTNSARIVRRKYTRKIKNHQSDKIQDVTTQAVEDAAKVSPKKVAKVAPKLQDDEAKKEVKTKRSSPRIEKRSEFSLGTDKMNIKRFFPVKKKKRINNTESVKSVFNNIVESNDIEAEVQEKKLPADDVPQSDGVNLRKRKSDNKNPGNKIKKSKIKKPNTKKLRAVKSITSEGPPSLPEMINQTEVKDFFGELVTDPDSDLNVNQEDEKPPILEIEKDDKDEKVEHITDDKDVSLPKLEIEMPPLLPQSSAVQPKRKVRKPVRGLNDCIAMLTSKLSKTFDDSTVRGEGSQMHEEPKKSEYILKVPFSNEHFHLRSQASENECLDLSSNVKQSCKLSDDGEKVPQSEVPVTSVDYHAESLNDDKQTQITQELGNDEEVFVQPSSLTEDLKENDHFIVNPTTETETTNSPEKRARETDSEDEVPLSNLLQEERSLLPEINNSNLEDKPVDTPINLFTSVSDGDIPPPIEETEKLDTANKPKDRSFEEVAHSKEKLNLECDAKLSKKKDVSVLMEINDNLCENIELSNTINPVFESRIDNKLEDSLLVTANLTLPCKDFTKLELTETKDSDNSQQLDHCESQTLSMFNKFNFFTKNNVDDIVWKNAVSDIIDDESPLSAESNDDKNASDFKENSIVDERAGKHKQRKKSIKTRNRAEAQKNPDAEKINRKGSKSVKTKALKSVFDDVLLELSESVVDENVPPKIEAVPQDDVFLPSEAKEDSINDDTLKLIDDQTSNSQENDDDKTSAENAKELRRSSRNSKRVTSYNETDLLDPLLDDIESDRTISKIIKETTKDIFGGKRKHRQKKVKNGQVEKKLNGDELFDLLKSTTNENIVLSKPTNTFFNTFDEISNEFNDDNFDVLEDILEKSIAVIEENLSEQAVLISTEAVPDYDKVNGQCVDTEVKVSPENKKTSKKKSKKHKNKNPAQSVDSLNDSEHLLSVESIENTDASLNESQSDIKSTEKSKNIYCEICNKSFSRMESLTKHKRTLTHISKLSELEAKEAAMKNKSTELSTNEETETTHMSTNSTKELNLLDMLGSMDDGDCKQFSSPFTVNVNNSNLKLADIINDVLNKPMLKKDGEAQSFDEIIMQNENEQPPPEIRRCKSLAERKSFESENCLVTNNDTHVKNVDYLESEMSNAAAGTILEKQITLLENIIENRSGLEYIEELSVSSSVNDNMELDNEIDIADSKQVESVSVYSEKKTTQSNTERSFLKPLQYEEISEDSSLRNYDEQKSRKVLNRDEELFLECCSLLKSGSEGSSYSKKLNNLSKGLNNPDLKRGEETDWLEGNCVSQKENCDFVECYSDSSRIRTPLGDNFSQEESNSATISSQWEVNNATSKKENKNLTFEKVFSGKNEIFCERNEMEKLHTVVSSFDRVISEVLHTELDTSNENMKKDSVIDLEEISSSNDNDNFKDSGVVDGKKMLTKGAMKVFEGLKVSIPTEELNIDKILTSGSSVKTQDDPEVHIKPSKMKRNCQPQNKKAGKTKHNSKSSNLKKFEMNSKEHDVYDFEETQDNSDVFTKPDFRRFREKGKKTEKLDGSDDDSRDYTDGFSIDALSSSTSSVSEMLPPKTETEQNITKKKCMIMGRIFKNAVKSRSVDEDIRNIPVIDNTKLVENFVLNCSEPTENATDKKPRMTEEEMNLAFDKLVNSKAQESKETSPKTCSLLHKSGVGKKKQKIKTKKRSHGNSDSSDDEFNLQKYSKKRHKKKNNNTEESCINLEQELRECIGVASRKSQRKCTSGKQNVLIEYWSSDESSFEALLEKQIVESVKKNNVINGTSSSVPETKVESKVEPENIPIFETSQVTEEVPHKKTKNSPQTSSANRRKRIAANPLYHWSSSSEDESRDLIEVRPIRDELEDDEDRPVQHGWIVGDSPKKLVTMLAQAKGKKCDVDSVKEHGKRRTSTFS